MYVGKLIIISTLVLALSACAAVPSSHVQSPDTTARGMERGQLYLVEPLQADQTLEFELLQLTELLYRAELDASQRAQLLHRRAMTFDYLGLTTLALVDINQALEIKPDMVEAYHSLGIYYAQLGEYQRAFEAFDSVIELQPDHEYVYLNRGLVSYYNGQYALALSDFTDYYRADPGDPFRVIWSYFAAYQLNPGRAYEQLTEAWGTVDAGVWGHSILRFLIGEIDDETLVMQAFQNAADARQLAYKLCEVYFYLGKVAAQRGLDYQAMNYFKLALSTNVFPYLEHRYARTELHRVRDRLRMQ